MSMLELEINEVIIVNKLETETIEIKLRSDGIMQFNKKDHFDFSVKEYDEVIRDSRILSKGKAFPRLIFIDHFF